jgi:hypothetical protein
LLDVLSATIDLASIFQDSQIDARQEQSLISALDFTHAIDKGSTDTAATNGNGIVL